MIRRSVLFVVGVGLVCGGFAAARQGGHQHGSARPLAAWNLVEKVNEKESKATAVEVTLTPGEASPAHRHPGPALGYVLEGQYEWGIDDQPSKVLKAGETFYEPGGCLHRVSKNPGKVQTRVIAWVIHPREAKDLVIPEEQGHGAK